MRDVHSIYVHHSASSRDDTTRDEINQWHRDRGWSGIGYHYVIEGDGSIVEGRPLWKAGAHVKGNNSKTVGICLTGNFEIEQPSREQLESLWQLLEGTMANFNLQRHNVFGHKEWHQANTLCPGSKLLHYIEEWRKRG